MSARADFKVGDVVQLGNSGEKGKIIDIIRPIGTYCMYKVHTYNTGEIKTAAKHELVKGLPDENFVDLFNCFQQSEVNEALSNFALHQDYESEFQELVSHSQFQEVPPIHCLQNAPVSTMPQNEQVPMSDAVQSNRFASVPYSANEFREMQKNKNTESKTKSHMRLINEFLASKNEKRLIHLIPHGELDQFLQEFVLCVRQKDGSEYEPTTLRGMISSLDRYLTEKGYGYCVARSKEFAQTMATVQSKGKDLKKQGKGNKENAAHQITDEEVDLLYKAGELGNQSPSSLINTLWYNNTLHFGIRGGAMEHRQLKWGDVTFGYCQVTKCEYLEFAERQTKTRTGITANNVRKQNPRSYAACSDRCPVMTYKTYAKHRPTQFSGADDPFYLAPVTHDKHPGEQERWFISQPIGVNKLKDLMKVMARNANLSVAGTVPKRLTNTSVRKRLCQTLLQNNVPDTQAVLITGHKNPASLNNYRVLSDHQQKEMSDLLAGETKRPRPSVVECRSQNVSNSQTCNSFVAHNVPSLSLFTNANITGGTFNITIQNTDKK